MSNDNIVSWVYHIYILYLLNNIYKLQKIMRLWKIGFLVRKTAVDSYHYDL